MPILGSRAVQMRDPPELVDWYQMRKRVPRVISWHVKLLSEAQAETGRTIVTNGLLYLALAPLIVQRKESK